MIKMKTKGDLKRTKKFLNFISNNTYILNTLKKYGEIGVNALSVATPKRSGLTASSWYYDIKTSNGQYSIEWKNSNIVKGVNIAIVLQYGHGTGTGGYVKGIDYINPALKPVFDRIADDLWKEVTNA